MLKLIPSFPQSGTPWDHQGKSNITQIFITSSEYRIDSIQFAYVEDGGVVLSERLGRSEGCDILRTVHLTFIFTLVLIISLAFVYTCNLMKC